MITELQPNEIFVFGSNYGGVHAGGAAKQAHEEFGAEMGIGEGLTGQCYALPTLTKSLEKMPLYEIERGRNRLFSTARALPEKTFLLTKVGCGIAGYEEESIRKVFCVAHPENIIYPNDWKI